MHDELLPVREGNATGGLWVVAMLMYNQGAVLGVRASLRDWFLILGGCVCVVVFVRGIIGVNVRPFALILVGVVGNKEGGISSSTDDTSGSVLALGSLAVGLE